MTDPFDTIRLILHPLLDPLVLFLIVLAIIVIIKYHARFFDWLFNRPSHPTGQSTTKYAPANHNLKSQGAEVGTQIESYKTTDEATQPVQRREDLPQSETNDPMASSQDKQVTRRAKRTFSEEEKELFDKFEGLGLVAHSEAMLDVFARIETYAITDIAVLITGEPGTGKENIARAIHRLSSRSSGPFLPINCAGLAESLLESELFGIEKDVATGVSPRKGKFRSAAGGTLFFDEIGDMPARMQATVLRSLQDKKITPVGGDTEIYVDVRFIFATNKNLDEAVTNGPFRADLLSRIKKAQIVAPPLREREQDIPYLAEYFYGQESQKLGLSISFSRSDFKGLSDRDWQGNVRDLENYIQRVATVLHKHGRGQNSRFLRRIIADPDANVSGHVESDEPILRQKVDWDLLQEFVDADFTLTKTATKIRMDRERVTRRICSICLRLGHHFGYDVEKIVSHLSSQGFLSKTQVEEFTKVLQKNWEAVIRFQEHPTTKLPFYADEKNLAQELWT